MDGRVKHGHDGGSYPALCDELALPLPAAVRRARMRRMTLDRDSIRRGLVRESVAEAERLGLYRALTAAERAASRRAVHAGRRAGEAAVVFGFGLLMGHHSRG